MTTSPSDIGIDYSTSNIYVCSSNGRFLTVPVQKKASESVTELMKAFLDMIVFTGSHAVCIEKPWSNTNQLVSMQMTRIATIIEVAAGLSGLKTYLVHPGTWRKEIFGKGTGKSTKEFKEMALAYAHEHDINTTDHNIADAYCLAQYMERLDDNGDLYGQRPADVRVHSGRRNPRGSTTRVIPASPRVPKT